MSSTVQKIGAEFLGTFWLVFAGCGAAVLATTAAPGDTGAQVAIGWLGVALAFGLAVTTGAYALGHISGGHFNPAISLGLSVAGRLPWRELPVYVVSQLVGAVAGAAVLYGIASGRAGFDPTGAFATNGYADRSPEGYGLVAALLVEVVLTAVFVLVVLGTTGPKGAPGLAPLAIGLTLVVIHLISIPVDNTSVNPARSIAPALFAGSAALGQVWLFIVAPLVGGVIAALVHKGLLATSEERGDVRVEQTAHRERVAGRA
ncbi:aquaporin Z [Quadrisphaera oryzae]|uniref:aquaporin Z n=1 Tax=Quadrisphaera TaxID=317661 RepID=UPI0016477D92|nr:aquaporin Z [Quadrisphaera sp. RL12-1S]MBC3761215.1 aquaporin Z [Quadrisphaera sp. RL12-1S]